MFNTEDGWGFEESLHGRVRWRVDASPLSAIAPSASGATVVQQFLFPLAQNSSAAFLASANSKKRAGLGGLGGRAIGSVKRTGDYVVRAGVGQARRGMLAARHRSSVETVSGPRVRSQPAATRVT
mmetsp:Transcript_42386/g.99490  ORF Transcript_42386/g.99490 Transcript_42386/m.99490 type:complete len:125 (+) Transcript_42386:105-479(+)